MWRELKSVYVFAWWWTQSSVDVHFCRARVSVKGERAGRSHRGAACGVVAVLPLLCLCRLLRCDLCTTLWAVFSFGESCGKQRSSLCPYRGVSWVRVAGWKFGIYALARVSRKGGAGTGLSQSRNGGAQKWVALSLRRWGSCLYVQGSALEHDLVIAFSTQVVPGLGFFFPFFLPFFS